MKKNAILLTYFLCQALSSVFAQAPNGYYDNAQGKKGKELQQTLSQIITANHFVLDYGSTAAARLMDLTTDGYIYDIYSYPCCQISPNATGTGTTEQCKKYSFEHIFCQNWFNPDSLYNCLDNNPFPVCSDLHHVFPTDHYVNSSYHNNSPYGEVFQPRKIAQNGTRWGYANFLNCDEFIEGKAVFEPADEFKGDIARALLYVSIRYMNEDATFGSSEMTEKSQFKPWALEMLKKWAAIDPVSQKEIDRNNAIYNYSQFNRNPLIDHPELVELLWGSDSLYNTFGTVSAEDALRPTVTAITFNDNQIFITFSKEMNMADAEAISNYSITRGIAIAAASYNANNHQVTLTLANTLTRNTQYAVYISNIRSTDGYYVKATAPQFLHGNYHSTYSACQEPRTLLALWSFDDFAATAPLVVPANNDEGMPEIYNTSFIYADGSHGSSSFSSSQLGNNTGDLGGDPRSAAKKGKSLTLKTASANGQSIVLGFSTRNWKEIMLTFVDKRSNTGFEIHNWEWSLDGDFFEPINVNNTIENYGTVSSSSVWLMRELDLRTLDVNDKDSVFLRLTIDSASAAAGTNSFDNFALYGEPLDYTEIPDWNSNDEFVVFPNPTRGAFTIRHNGENGHSLCQIFDITGKRIVSKDIDNQEIKINIESYPAGLYLIKMTNLKTGETAGKKILLQK